MSSRACDLHWPEYAIELTEMALYLFFTCVSATFFQHPVSPIRHLLPNDIVRRACFGISVGATIVVIALTPWGKQSGGHLNPATTFTFYRLGKIDPTIRYAATLPGMYGVGVALVAEVAISFVLMLTVLFASNRNSLSRYTPYFVGALYAIFITIETPLSGTSMNPARRARHFEAATGMTFGSISSPRRSACCLPQKSFFGCAAASARTAPNSITPMTNVVFSATARNRFDPKEVSNWLGQN